MSLTADLDEAEEIVKLKYRTKQNTQSQKNGKYLKEWWEKLTKGENREKGWKTVCEEIKMEKFWLCMKDIRPQIYPK